METETRFQELNPRREGKIYQNFKKLQKLIQENYKS